MGIGIMSGSSSSYDCVRNNKVDVNVNLVSKTIPPNPDPNNFEVLRVVVYGGLNDYMVAEIKYANCDTYEGRKILVYQFKAYSLALSNNCLDPHFSEIHADKSPIARFTPNKSGWKMATNLAKKLSNK